MKYKDTFTLLQLYPRICIVNTIVGDEDERFFTYLNVRFPSF